MSDVLTIGLTQVFTNYVRVNNANNPDSIIKSDPEQYTRRLLLCWGTACLASPIIGDEVGHPTIAQTKITLPNNKQIIYVAETIEEIAEKIFKARKGNQYPHELF